MITPQKNITWENLTCLIVDDDKFSRTFIKTALYQIGIKNIKEAATSKEGLEQLHNYKTDIILLDQQMPEENGIDFVKHLQSSAEYSTIPVIMITVDTTENTVMEAKNLGIKEYIIKPISPITLKKRIANTIGLKQE